MFNFVNKGTECVCVRTKVSEEITGKEKCVESSSTQRGFTKKEQGAGEACWPTL